VKLRRKTKKTYKENKDGRKEESTNTRNEFVEK
jgi:hypothetical protein